MAKRRHYLATRTVRLSRPDRKNEATIAALAVDDLKAEIDPQFVAALNEDLDNLHRNILPANIKGQVPYAKIKHTVLKDVVIRTVETLVPHSLGAVPAFYHVNVKSTGYYGSAPSVWETAPPDAVSIYLQADAEATVDVIVRG